MYPSLYRALSLSLSFFLSLFSSPSLYVTIFSIVIPCLYLSRPLFVLLGLCPEYSCNNIITIPQHFQLSFSIYKSLYLSLFLVLHVYLTHSLSLSLCLSLSLSLFRFIFMYIIVWCLSALCVANI